jgi:hypothetical protein
MFSISHFIRSNIFMNQSIVFSIFTLQCIIAQRHSNYKWQRIHVIMCVSTYSEGAVFVCVLSEGRPVLDAAKCVGVLKYWVML